MNQSSQSKVKKHTLKTSEKQTPKLSPFSVSFESLGSRKSLQIDTYTIEKEHESPLVFKKLNLSHSDNEQNLYNSLLGALNQSFDVLSGRVFHSKSEGNLDLSKKVSVKPRLKKPLQEKIEVKFDTEKDYLSLWTDFKQKLVSKSRCFECKNLITDLKNKTKAWIHLKNYRKHPRNPTKVVSSKIENFIKSTIQAKQHRVKKLISNNIEVPSIKTLYHKDYIHTEDMLVELFLILWNKDPKALSCKRLSVIAQSELIIPLLYHTQNPLEKLNLYEQLVGSLLVSRRFDLAETYANKGLNLFEDSETLKVWQCWVKVVNCKFSEAYYALKNLKTTSEVCKLCLVYSFLNSCWYNRTKRSIAYAKEVLPTEWSNLVVGDMLLSMKKPEGASLLSSVRGSNQVRFLAAYRLFNYYYKAEKYSESAKVVEEALGSYMPEDWQLVLKGSYFKACAKLGLNFQTHPNELYLKYTVAKLALKHQLEVPATLVSEYLDTLILSLKNLNLDFYLSDLYYWKFELFSQEALINLALTQRTLAAKHLSSSNKLKTLKSFSQKVEYCKNLVLNIYEEARRNNLNKCFEIQAQIKELDKFLATSIKVILSIRLENFGPNSRVSKYLKENSHRYESHFALWLRAYNLNKQKPKKFKVLQAQESIDQRDKNHPLYVLERLKKHKQLLEDISECCISVPHCTLWALAGKSYGYLTQEDSYVIMAAKSYQITNFKKSITILAEAVNQNNPHPLLYYYLAKYYLTAIKHFKEISNSQYQEVLFYLSCFEMREGIDRLFELKALYYNSELAFMKKNTR